MMFKEVNEDENYVFIQTASVSIYNGRIYGYINGTIMDKNNNFCISGDQSVESMTMGKVTYSSSDQKTCCSEIEYVEIPDVYDLTSTDLTALLIEYPGKYDFRYGPLKPDGCEEYNQNCSLTFPPEDFQIEFWSYIWLFEDMNVGELIRRNGQFFKNDNSVYSPEDPCWTNSDDMILKNDGSSGRYDATFCCVNFVKLPSEKVSSTTELAVETMSPSTNTKSVATTFSHDNFTTPSMTPTTPTTEILPTSAISVYAVNWFLFLKKMTKHVNPVEKENENS
uniref:Uncharacterized protein n=1 Tax=Panagrolaimus sp. ES5 TaxID=591445 RepID=A0AC34F120_9BILA